jgi:hypothetical protein
VLAAASRPCLNNIAVSLHRQTLCSVSLALSAHADGVAISHIRAAAAMHNSCARASLFVDFRDPLVQCNLVRSTGYLISSSMLSLRLHGCQA